MTARGVNFLELWVSNDVPARTASRTEARNLADILRISAAAAGHRKGVWNLAL